MKTIEDLRKELPEIRSCTTTEERAAKPKALTNSTPPTKSRLTDLASSANKSTISTKWRKAPKKVMSFPAAPASSAKSTMTRKLPETRLNEKSGLSDLASIANKRRKASCVIPAARVTLELLGGKCSGSAIQATHTFELVPSDHIHVTQTSLGLYDRTKMTIVRSNGGELGGFGSALPPNTGAVARVWFGTSTTLPSRGEVELRNDSLGLPTSARGGCPALHDAVGIELVPEDSFPKMQWRQLGKTDGKTVVLQLGFRRLSHGTVPAGETCVRGYCLTQAFLSQPKSQISTVRLG